MQPLCIFILTIFIGLSVEGQTVSTDKVKPYNYDTTLKGGYKILLIVDDSLEHLYLKKGDNTINELSSMARGLPYKNLGYVGADFKNYFVLVHSYGSGNPNYIELIKKTTGLNVLKDSGAAWIDVEKNQEFLLYSDNDVPTQKDKMTLLNIRTGQKQKFNFPSDIFQEPQVLNRIKIHKLTDRQLVIRYDTEKGSKTRLYNR